MALTTISSPPDTSLWKKLEEHQSATPSSFSEAVLHGSCKGATLIMGSDQKELLPGFLDEEEEPKKEEKTEDTTEKKDEEDEYEDSVEIADEIIEGVEVYVVSEKLILYLPTRSSGVEIPYPQITLHAITATKLPSASEKKSAVYMQIDPHGSHASFDDHDVECLEITLVPTTADITAQELYQALTDCSNLHPEPNNDWDGIGDGEDEDGQRIFFEHEGGVGSGLGSGITFLGGADEVGGIPALAPGGWITAENADSITWTDTDGKTGVGLGSLSGGGGGGGLGPGAGTVRSREEEGDEANDDDKGDEEGGEEGGEAKWRRTG